MLNGQILVYRYNGLHNSRNNVERNVYTLRDVNAADSNVFRESIMDALDEVPPGKGYVLIKYNGKIYIAEKDCNDVNKPYIRHEVKFHPLANRFTI